MNFFQDRNMCMKINHDHFLNNKTEEKITSKCDIFDSQEHYVDPEKKRVFFKMPARGEIGFETKNGSQIFFWKKMNNSCLTLDDSLRINLITVSKFLHFMPLSRENTRRFLVLSRSVKKKSSARFFKV